MRSKLLIPGSRPELFAKAMEGQADALSIDLEDAVPEARKAEARAAAGRFVRDQPAGGRRKRIVVRINGLSSGHFEADLAAITGAGLSMIDLPKVEDADEILSAVAQLEAMEAARGLTPQVRLLASIESPRGLRLAAGIAQAHLRVAGLQLGYGQLLEPLGISRSEHDYLRHVQRSLRLAAAEAGIGAYDAPLADINDAAGFQREAEAALALGFAGKSCIHPSQVGLANTVFFPGQEQIMQALRIMEGAHLAQQKGQASFQLDGRTVDAPLVRRASQCVELALELGILNG